MRRIGKAFVGKVDDEQVFKPPTYSDKEEREEETRVAKGPRRTQEVVRETPNGSPFGPDARASQQPPIQLLLNNDFKSAIDPNPGNGWENSIAKAGDVVFATGNYFAAVSLDGGRTFQSVNPYSGLENVDGGFCCDQHVVYAPAANSFIWIRQTAPASGGPNRLRISAATPAELAASAGQSWPRTWDLTPTTFGLGGRTPSWWMDFPSITVGRNHAYLTVNVIGSGQALLWRFPLQRLADGGNLAGTATMLPAVA